MTNKLIQELPPFTPQLIDFRHEEFHRHSLQLLKFPIIHDEAALDMAPFQIDPPVAPPDPLLPLLPHVWYPKPVQEVRDWVLGQLMASRPALFAGKVRLSQANELMRPLLASEGPVQVRGAIGMGKTTLLQHMATHERTTRRYRRVWWIDDPIHLVQTLALALNVPQALTIASQEDRLELFRQAIDDNTLLVLDNLTAEEAEFYKVLSPHIIFGVEMAAEELAEEEPMPDPDGVATLRTLPRTDALEILALHCGITDSKQMRGQMRAWLTHIVQLLDGHPLAMRITAALFREDGLPMEQLVDLLDARMTTDKPKPKLAIDLSYDALPSDYQGLLQALGALPATGACLDAILSTANIRNELMGYRGLAFLARRGFVQRDERPGGRYQAHPLIWERLATHDLHAQDSEIGERVRRWAMTVARRHSETAEMVYRYQNELVYVLIQAQKHRMDDVVHKMNMTLGSYFREYAPQYLGVDMPTPRLMGKRADVARLMRDALDLVKAGDLEKAEDAINEAQQLTEKYSSDHEIAEVFSVSALIADQKGLYRKASKQLEHAAKLAFELDNKESLHILRIGLAMLYRKQDRYNDALGVLDDEPDTFAERARIYRASQQWDLMMAALDQAGNLSAKERAESYVLAGLYAEALAAIANQQDSSTTYLRAKIYHLQDDLENAIRGYQLAIDALSNEHPSALEARLAIGTAYATQLKFKEAETEFDTVLEIQKQKDDPDYYLYGKALSLLAALNLINQNPNEAIRQAEAAIKALEKDTKRPTARIQADAYRVMARAQWRLGRHKKALSAYLNEVDQAQSAVPRDEYGIGVALHHLADAYSATDEFERAIGNYRRALTHKDEDSHFESYFMTVVALHHALYEAERYEDALEVSKMALQHLDKRPPADLQYLGYLICRHALAYFSMDRPYEYETTLGRWMSVLAGRSDALRDNDRPQMNLLAVNLAVRSLLASHRADEALPLAEQALAIAEHHYASTEYAWSARRDLAEAYWQLHQWQTCIDTYAPLFYEGVQVDDYTYAFAQEQTAYAYMELLEYDQAIEHYHLAIARQPDEQYRALLLEQIAQIHLDRRETERAIEVIQQAADIINPQTHTGDAARIHTHLAQLYAGSNQYSEAVNVYEAALSMLRELPDIEAVHMARVYQSLGESNEAQGQYPQAALAYRNALDTLEAAHTPAYEDHRLILLKLADVKIALEQFEEATVLYQQARDETEHYGTELELGAVTAKLADLLRDAQNYEEALYYYEQALEYQPASTVPRERAQTLRGYGRTLAITEQFEDARLAWNQALSITTDAPPLEIALTHRAIGQAYRAQSLWTEAEEAFVEALKHHQPKTEEIAETLRLYAHTLIEAKRHDEAITSLRQALDIEEGLPKQINIRIVKTLDLLAYAQEHNGDITSAVTSYHKAIVYMDRTHQPIQIANRLRTLGRLYTILERWSDAHKALEDALEIEFAHQPRSDARISQNLEMIAVAYRREGQLEKAADAYKRMASYANLTKTAEADLKATVGELERQQATLETAHASLSVLERTQADVLDIVNVYALIAQTQANLSNMNASNDAIDSLLTALENHAHLLKVVDERRDYRALAYIFEASQAASQGDLASARAHFQMALPDTNNPALRWVVERGLESVQG